MRLHLIYRSCAHENRKPRPEFYSKATALRSCLHALDASPWQARITFLNDGLLPDGLLALMRGRGEIVTDRFGSARRSYWGALRMALQGAPEADLVWLAEDDYLYLPDAFTVLHRAVQRLPDVDYFALYGGESGAEALPAIVAQSAVVDGLGRRLTDDPATGEWFALGSTTSTFGARPAALQADRLIHRLGPLSGGAWDNAIMMTLAGRAPFHWSRLLSGLAEPSLPLRTRLARSTVKGPMRLAMNLLAGVRASRRRTLAVRIPNLATHLELPPLLAPGHDWAEVAARVDAAGRPVAQSAQA